MAMIENEPAENPNPLPNWQNSIVHVIVVILGVMLIVLGLSTVPGSTLHLTRLPFRWIVPTIIAVLVLIGWRSRAKKSPSPPKPSPKQTGPQARPIPPRARHPAVGAVLLLLGLAWSAYLVHQVLTVKGSYNFSWYEERTIQDNVRLAAPFLVIALTYVIVGLGVVCRCRWTRVPALVLSALALAVLGLYALLFLFLKLTGACPFPI